MAIDWQRLGTALSGAGAGLLGQGQQWRQGIQQERALQAQQEQQLSEERRRAAAQDLYGLSTLLGQGRTDAAMALMNNRERDIMELGGDSVMTSYLRDLMQAGEYDEAKAFADMALQQAEAAGYIQVPKEEAYTLGPQQQRFRGDQLVSENTMQDPEQELQRRELEARILDLEDRIRTRQEERAAVEQQQAENAVSQVRRIDQVLMPEIEAAMEEATGFATGRLGALTSLDPAGPAARLRGRLDVIRGNLGFDQLQAMRDASPTGGALGQVSERELMFLQGTIANLNPNLGADRIQEQLAKVRRHYENWKLTLQGINPDEIDGGDGSAESGSVPTISGQADYDNLPPGATYIYNGVEYVKGQ